MYRVFVKDKPIGTVNEAINWIKTVEEIEINRDRENLILLMALEDELNKARITWLKLHYDELYFDIDFIDKGFAFVEVVTITNDIGNEIEVFDFYGAGEAQDFVEMLGQ